MTVKRVLIVGLGSIGKRHARVVRQLLPQCEIIALRHRGCSGDPEPGIDHCVTEINAALALKPDVAVIANPASHHVEAALPLARSGVHLLVEKPISNMAANVPELIKTCRAQGVTLMTAYNMRFLPSLQRFRQHVRELRVGRVLSVRAEVGQFLPGWRAGSDYRQDVSAQARLGGGALLELSHEIDYLRWIFGEIDWVSAAMLRQSALEIDVEDTVHLILGFHPDPARGAPVASVDIDFIRHDTTRGCTVIGEKGSLRWNAMESKVEVFEAGGSQWTTLDHCPVQRDDSYLGEWRHFLECVETGTRPAISGDDGLAVLHVIEAVRAASSSGQRMQVETT